MVLNKPGWNFEAAPAQQQHTCHSWSQAFTLQLSIIMVFLWNVTRVFLSSSNYAAPISFGRVQLYVGPDKREGSKKVLHTGERTQPNQPTQHTDTEFQGARGAGGIKSCSSARTLVPSRQFKTGQTNSWILVSNKKFPNKMWKAFEEITQQQKISTDSRHLKKFLDGQTGSSRTLLINIHTCNGLLDWSGIFLFHDRFQIFTLNDSYLEFGDDDSLRTTWTFAAEAAAQVWHGTHPDFAETKSRPKFDSVQR